MRQFFKRVMAWVLAIITTVVLGVALQTQNVLARLGDIGADVSLSERLSMTAYDIFRLGSLYVIFVTPALLIAILICDIIAKRIKFARPLLYAIGGAAAILVMLFAMKMKFFDIHLLNGAKDALGISLQMLAGAIGGLIFAMFYRPAQAEAKQ